MPFAAPTACGKCRTPARSYYGRVPAAPAVLGVSLLQALPSASRLGSVADSLANGYYRGQAPALTCGNVTRLQSSPKNL